MPDDRTASDAATLHVQRSGSLFESEVAGEIVALEVVSGKCYGFNPTASRILNLLAQPQTLAALCARLTEEFDVDPETCRADVRRLLDDLARDGLVTLTRA
ncbi:HPr-rel-A system PqqD family peptide chaperone [Sphingomonas sp.]|uniref:HPr-rel-A system PqqD family peptide chaperone n=1 Tax=Sphingomonas sp. TaxID=28214 RepID=UPI00307D5A10